MRHGGHDFHSHTLISNPGAQGEETDTFDEIPKKIA